MEINFNKVIGNILSKNTENINWKDYLGTREKRKESVQGLWELESEGCLFSQCSFNKFIVFPVFYSMDSTKTSEKVFRPFRNTLSLLR